MQHETKREWFQKAPLLGKILYLMGCLKLLKRKASFDGKWLYLTQARRIHPFCWIWMLAILIIHGWNKQTIKENTVWY